MLQAPPDIFDRVRRLQRDLAHHRGMWHRTAVPDLFIAETALSHNAGVLHHDRDYARIAKVRAPNYWSVSSPKACGPRHVAGRYSLAPRNPAP